MKNIPIGIQAFSKLIEGGFVYLDKTDMIYRLANRKACYFLSRPRRFGKSLTLSTLKAYFNGKKELFSGLKIEKLETKWEKYPVLHFDFLAATYNSVNNFRETLSYKLNNYEIEYGLSSNGSLYRRFEKLIKAANKQTDKEVIVLVDEYDKPLLNNVGNDKLWHEIHKEMEVFYSVLKTCDEQIKMAFITGVTPFCNDNPFNGVDNLNDISYSPEFAALCGATESDILGHLDGHIQQMADYNNISKEDCRVELNKWHGGYQFHEKAECVYNPCSLMRSLARKETQDFWIETGTPSFLTKQMRKYGTCLNNIDNVECEANLLAKNVDFAINPIPTLYQCGFLTIKGYDPNFDTYTLGVPNQEVRDAIQYLR